MRILVVNSGSSSLKLRVLEVDDDSDHDRGPGVEPARIWSRDEPPISELSDGAISDLLSDAPDVDAAGHRIVHGGAEFTGPALLDEQVLKQLEELADLAPLHQPPALRAARALTRARPNLPAVACFDTSFHRTMPEAAVTYPLPESWRRHPIQRYGFHGLSHAWVARRVAALVQVGPGGSEIGGAGELRLVSCHLGAGASLAAIHDGRCVDTTMGFTPLEGLAMATRSGNVDPGLVLWLIRRAGLTPDQVEHGLNHESGLAGLAGNADMRTVLNLADAGDEAASLAIEVYLRRLRAGIAGMATAMGGLDALAFTGAIGEHAWQIRAGAAEGLEFMGVRLDAGTNQAAAANEHADVELTGPAATVRSYCVQTREDIEIAQDTVALLTGGR
ncbi:MAG: acetate/propionate family kinase [Micromonosporaceae bacterium]